LKYFIRNIIFLAAGFTTVLAAIFYFVDRNSTDKGSYPGALQERVIEEIQNAEVDMEKVLNRVRTSGKTEFGNVYLESRFPYFLFKNKQLLVWSKHTFIPTYANLVSYDAPQLVSFPEGKFILLRNSVNKNGDEYTLYCLINLTRQEQTKNGSYQEVYNANLFTFKPSLIGTEFSGAQEIVRDANGRALFSVKIENPTIDVSHHIPYKTLILGFIAALFWGLYVVRWVIKLKNKHRYELALVWITTYLICLRYLMVRFSIPFVFCGTGFFNPDNYTFSNFANSLGDVLINSICLVWGLSYISGIYYKTVTYRWLANWPLQMKQVACAIIVVVSYLMFGIIFYKLTELYEEAGFTMDITLSIAFTVEKLVWLGTYIAISCAYFLSIHLLMSIFNRLSSNLLFDLAIIGLGTLAGGVLLLLLKFHLHWIYFIHTIYILIVYLGKLPKTYYSFRYLTTIYYFLCALVCALLSTYICYTQEVRTDTANKKAYAEELLKPNDLYTEFLLKRTSKLVSSDTTVNLILRENPLLSSDLIRQRVKDLYLSPYLNQYDVVIQTYDPHGHPHDMVEGALDRESFQLRIEKQSKSLVTNNIYLIKPNQRENTLRYVSFIDVLAGDTLVGSVAIDLSRIVDRGYLSKIPNHLSTGATTSLSTEPRQYSSAVFKSNELVGATGNYNYERNFPANLLGNTALFSSGISYLGYHHTGLPTPEGHTLVTSSKEWNWKEFAANFSFMYLVLVVFITAIIVAYAIRYHRTENRLTYLTKMQVMLNATFILPFLLILLIVISVIYKNYRENQETNYLATTQNLSVNIATYMDGYMTGKMSKAYVEQEIQKVGKEARTAVNVYDKSGRLFFATRPLINDNHTISDYVNPDVYQHIYQRRESNIVTDESVYKEQYKVANVGMRSPENRFLGVTSVSFFNSEVEVKQGIIEIVASVLIIFAALMILFLIVSYLGANLLIHPLKVLTKNISKTNLYQLEPINWKSKDEIGILIRRYNQMLVNLQENRQALSSSEKQSAWREMAKQVAHEIKNPLTPMKLTLQQLQRTVKRDDPNSMEKVSKAMESIIDQIDTIGHIAQSFSDIANMPLPVSETFEVTSVLSNAVELYDNNPKIQLLRSIEKGPVYITGDRQQFGNCITNLIINAIQSVPAFRKIEIEVRLHTHEGNVLIEIKDNGSGIPKSIGNRVFLPNFTTKEEGSGFGLAIAKRIVEHAAGSIWFETEEGFGTTFFLSIPLSR
jgi:two-component system nitrogen regulation sensor histidine kinase NtrY